MRSTNNNTNNKHANKKNDNSMFIYFDIPVLSKTMGLLSHSLTIPSISLTLIAEGTKVDGKEEEEEKADKQEDDHDDEEKDDTNNE